MLLNMDGISRQTLPLTTKSGKTDHCMQNSCLSDFYGNTGIVAIEHRLSRAAYQFRTSAGTPDTIADKPDKGSSCLTAVWKLKNRFCFFGSNSCIFLVWVRSSRVYEIRAPCKLTKVNTCRWIDFPKQKRRLELFGKIYNVFPLLCDFTAGLGSM